MNASVLKEIEGLRRLTVGGLRDRYREVFDEESRSNHKDFLFRRIAWRLQANAEGGLSERARRRALEIANDADLRIRAPKDCGSSGSTPGRTAVTAISAVGGSRDNRLPAAGIRSSPGTSRGARTSSKCWTTGSSTRGGNTDRSAPSPAKSPARGGTAFCSSD